MLLLRTTIVLCWREEGNGCLRLKFDCLEYGDLRSRLSV